MRNAGCRAGLSSREREANKQRKKKRVLGVLVEPEENEKLFDRFIVLATDWRKRWSSQGEKTAANKQLQPWQLTLKGEALGTRCLGMVVVVLLGRMGGDGSG